MNALNPVLSLTATVRKRRKMLVADLLCGAGGSSTGAQRALAELGLEMDLVCVNHWPTAIQTHQLNHPEARHFVQDIATVRPHLLVPEGYLDLLMASPTCTHHSNARGGKPTSDQQRSDPWHIVTWLTELRVKRIIIENVWEFLKWGPVDHRTGKPVKSRQGEYFHAWIETIRRLGFELEWRKLNAADYGDATTRQRFILMGRSDRKKISWPMPTHAKRGTQAADLFGELKPWRPAREVINWDHKGKSIFNRKKPLAPKTLARIYAGATRQEWPEPFLVILRNHMAAQGLDVPLPTIAARGQHIGLAQPMIVNMKGKSTASDAGEPLPTMTAHVAHLFAAEPFVLSPGSTGAAREVSEPMPTITTGGAGSGVEEPLGTVHAGGGKFGVVEAFVLSQASGGIARPVSEPMPTIVTGGEKGSGTALIAPFYGDGSGKTCSTTSDPLPTITARDRFGMVVPVTHTTGGPGARDVADPLPTITATGHVNLIEPGQGYDILFRMLEPEELAAAMGFNEEERRYEFAGTKTERVKQVGNAVSVAKMRACVRAIMADAAP